MHFNFRTVVVLFEWLFVVILNGRRRLYPERAHPRQRLTSSARIELITALICLSQHDDVFKTNCRSVESVDPSSRRFFSFDRFGFVKKSNWLNVHRDDRWLVSHGRMSLPMPPHVGQDTEDSLARRSPRKAQYPAKPVLDRCAIPPPILRDPLRWWAHPPIYLFRRRVRSIDRGQFPPPHLSRPP